MLLLSLFKISGHSMEPTLSQGQTVLASSIPFFFSKPKIGDIVLIRHSGVAPLSGAPQNDEENNKYLVKRITKINGEKYFVRGDNKKDSMDSRRFGWIKKKIILGKVILKL